MDDNDYLVKAWNNYNYNDLFVVRADRHDYRKEISDALREIGSRREFSPYSVCCYTETSIYSESQYPSHYYDPDPLLESIPTDEYKHEDSSNNHNCKTHEKSKKLVLKRLFKK